MMSYLWILLLGSLLATSAKAQDDVDPAEEAAAPGTQDPEADAAPEVKGDPDADKETVPTAEEIPPTVIEPKPAADPEAGADTPVTPVDGDAEPAAPVDGDAEPAAPVDGDAEPAAPVDGDAEPAAPVDGDAEPAASVDGDAEPAAPVDGDAEPAAPVDGDVEPATPPAGDTEPAAPAAGDVEPVTPADGDAEPVNHADGEAEPVTPTAAATTQEPAAVPEVEDSEAEQPTVNGEEEPTTDATPVQDESGPDDKTTLATDPDAANNGEEPTVEPMDPLVVLEKIVPEVKTDVKAHVPKDTGLNLEDALPAVDNQSQSGKSHGSKTRAHAAGATGDADKPSAQEASSGSLAAILSTIGVAVVGAVVGYFTYQKKKLCFKNRQEADPEAARKADAAEAQSDPQVLSNLLNSS